MNKFHHSKILFFILLVTFGLLLLGSCDLPIGRTADSDLTSSNQGTFRLETSVNNVKLVIHSDKSMYEKIKRIVNDSFIKSNPDKYRKIVIRAKYDSKNLDSLILYLLDKKAMLFDTAKVTFGNNYSVISIERGNYIIEEDAEFIPNKRKIQTSVDDSNNINKSGDNDFNDVELVFSTCEADLPSAVDAVNYAYDIATAKGYKALKLIGEDENKANIKTLLKSPNLIGWGRVGYGNEVGIVLDDGVLYYTYFSNLLPTALDHKVIFFDSGETHNPPLEDSILSAGVQKFIGGNRQLAIGPSEQVFKSFWDKVIADSEPITDSLNSSQLKYYFSTTAFGISGEGLDYLTATNN